MRRSSDGTMFIYEAASVVRRDGVVTLITDTGDEVRITNRFIIQHLTYILTCDGEETVESITKRIQRNL